MISVYTDGVGEVVAHLGTLDARLTDELVASISRLTIKLQDNVKRNFLSGQALGVRTGRGKRSIHQDVSVDGSRVTGIVLTNVFYMIGWELGWPDAKQRESMAAAQGKFALSGGSGNFKNGTPKQRAFLVPALKQMDDGGAITTTIQADINKATKQ